ncbi:MAG TPA: hypothetical protein VLH77_02475, partial [Gammaproteobacteria bacterium]|nr:hypothetical protein [Gammaproteobacteria bacterium]
MKCLKKVAYLYLFIAWVPCFGMNTPINTIPDQQATDFLNIDAEIAALMADEPAPELTTIDNAPATSTQSNQPLAAPGAVPQTAQAMEQQIDPTTLAFTGDEIAPELITTGDASAISWQSNQPLAAAGAVPLTPRTMSQQLNVGLETPLSPSMGHATAVGTRSAYQACAARPSDAVPPTTPTAWGAGGFDINPLSPMPYIPPLTPAQAGIAHDSMPAPMPPYHLPAFKPHGAEANGEQTNPWVENTETVANIPSGILSLPLLPLPYPLPLPAMPWLQSSNNGAVAGAGFPMPTPASAGASSQP